MEVLPPPANLDNEFEEEGNGGGGDDIPPESSASRTSVSTPSSPYTPIYKDKDKDDESLVSVVSAVSTNTTSTNVSSSSRISKAMAINIKEAHSVVKEDFASQLYEIYSLYNPSKLDSEDTIPRILETFAGRENELLEQLHMKYGTSAILMATDEERTDEEQEQQDLEQTIGA